MPLFFASQEAAIARCEAEGWSLGPWTLEPVLASTDLAWRGSCSSWVVRLLYNDGCGNSELQGWLSRD